MDALLRHAPTVATETGLPDRAERSCDGRRQDHQACASPSEELIDFRQAAGFRLQATDVRQNAERQRCKRAASARAAPPLTRSRMRQQHRRRRVAAMAMWTRSPRQRCSAKLVANRARLADQAAEATDIERDRRVAVRFDARRKIAGDLYERGRLPSVGRAKALRYRIGALSSALCPDGVRASRRGQIKTREHRRRC